MRAIPPTLLLLGALLAAGCGGGDATTESSSPKQRIDACLEQQPDATRADCEEWEQDGQLADDGSHKGHESVD